MSHTDSSSVPDDPVPPRNRRAGIGKFLLWVVIITVAWGLVAAAVPGIPSPGNAAKSLLHLAKIVSDDVYKTANHESLEEAAKRVLNEAHESGPFDSMRSDADRLTPERRKKLPAYSLQEDSALRSSLGALSKVPPIGGRVINIALIGIDSRLSVRNARADAIHLFTINPDSGIVEIMSIPRDTYTDLGYPDTTTFNIIANARALGWDGFLKRISELTKRGPIKYYAEVGFSQAMGVLEILGYNDPVSTLKFLRTRKTLPAGDIQRSHNQAVFLRQSLLGKFSLFTGATGDLILSAGLNFVSTNLTKDFCKGLIYALEQKHFPTQRPDAIRLRMLPMYTIRLKDMNPDSVTIARTIQRSRQILGDDETPTVNVLEYLRRANRQAVEDSARPGRVISRLQRLSEQHAWIQIRDKRLRTAVRDSLLTFLERAYRKVGKTHEADRVVDLWKSEDLLLPATR